jgi:catechol 2,3-dioxygenase-like lactoylglutathione lyase family enzyme
MGIEAFQHVNTRSADVERTREFYETVIGLTVGPRPPFSFRGYWLYLGEQAVLHLVQRADGDRHHEGTGNLDHVAFFASDYEGMRRRLVDRSLPFREAVVPRDGTRQIFVKDPDGLTIELNFAPLT